MLVHKRSHRADDLGNGDLFQNAVGTAGVNEIDRAEVDAKAFDHGNSIAVHVHNWDVLDVFHDRLHLLVVLGEVAKHRLRQHSDRLFDTAVDKSQFLCRRALPNLLTHYSGQQPYSKTSTIHVGSISSVIRAGFISNSNPGLTPAVPQRSASCRAQWESGASSGDAA